MQPHLFTRLNSFQASHGSGKRRMASFFLVGLMASLLGGLPITPPALAGHANETCQYNKYGSAADETNHPIARDGVRGTTKAINPAPNPIDGIARSVYIVGSSIDLMEFGWTWQEDSRNTGCCDNAPTVFALKLYNGNATYSEDGSNPGAGTLVQESNHTFAIRHNPDTNDPLRYEFHRSGLFFGYFNTDRMLAGGWLFTAVEGWARPVRGHGLTLLGSREAVRSRWSVDGLERDHKGGGHARKQ